MNIILDFYMKYLENLLIEEKNSDKNRKIWNKIKTKHNLVLYAIKSNNDKFNSNLIAGYILKDSSLINSNFYQIVLNTILEKQKIAQSKNPKNNTETFLISVMKNSNIKLTEKQKTFLIFELEDLTQNKTYEEQTKYFIDNIENFNLFYLILNNDNFSFQERKNIFDLFYIEEEFKFTILEELNLNIIKELNLNIKYDIFDFVNDINLLEIKEKYKDKENIDSIINKINLSKYIFSTISLEHIKNYKRI